MGNIMIERMIMEIEPQLELVFRIIIACVLGILIGLERKNRNKIAGVRTHGVVAFGAALMMLVSIYGFQDLGQYDGTRVAAQIVSGIGFLGAGIIVVRNHNSVSGLTTAAGIWATAGVGMCIGGGKYFLGISSTIILIVMQILLHKIRFLSDEPYFSELKIQLRGTIENVSMIEGYILEEHIDIVSIKLSKSNKESTKLEFQLLFPAQYDKIQLIDRLAEREEIISVTG